MFVYMFVYIYINSIYTLYIMNSAKCSTYTIYITCNNLFTYTQTYTHARTHE